MCGGGGGGGEREGREIEGGRWAEEIHLQSIGKDDIGIHGTNIQVVYHGYFQSCRGRRQTTQFSLYLTALLIKVGHLDNHQTGERMQL